MRSASPAFALIALLAPTLTGACRGADRTSVAGAATASASASPSASSRAPFASAGASVAASAPAPDPDVDPITGAFVVRPPLLARYEALGGAATLGAPIGPATSGRLGPSQTFAHGCIGPDGSGAFDRFTRCDAPPDLAPTLARLGREVSARSPGSDLALAVSWLPTGARYDFRGDERRVSASCAKWFWAAAALHRASIAEVEPAAVLAFGQSDNVRGRMLIDLAGGADAVNDYAAITLGVPRSALGLCRYTADQTRVATNCDPSAKLNSFFAPAGAVRFLEGVFRGDGLGPEKRDALLRWAKLMPNGGFSIGHRLPHEAEASMHHKRGELPTGCCGQGPGESWTAELAIVHTPRGPYAIAISLSRAHAYARQLATIEWASCVVYHALVEDSADPFAVGTCGA